MSLFAKIAQVQADIGGMKTDRTANVGTYKYDYITDSAMFAQVRGKLAPLGVATFVSVEQEEQRGPMTVVHVKVTFVDSESGDLFSVGGIGYGTDKSDKGCGKAITSAVRYAFTKTFLQGGDVDPEQEYIENASVKREATTPSKRFAPLREEWKSLPEEQKLQVTRLFAEVFGANATFDMAAEKWPGKTLTQILADDLVRQASKTLDAKPEDEKTKGRLTPRKTAA